MELITKKDYDELSKAVGDFVIDYVGKKPDSLICFAGGDTPLGLLKYLVEAVNENKVDLSKCRFVGLDEWVGLGRDVKGSCQEMLYNNFYDLIPVPKEQVCFFNGLAKDLNEECRRVDSFISDNGNLDLIVLGIGMNGHIGFNEPAEDFPKFTHCVDLTESTIQANARFFDKPEDVPTQAYTMGIGTIMRAKRILLIASGKDKAAIVKEALFGPVRPQVPASILQLHPDVTVVLDEEAASCL